MARSEITGTEKSRQILAHSQQRKDSESLQQPHRELQDNAERLLSRPVSINKKRRRSRRGKSGAAILRLLVVSVVVIAALGLIIWARGYAKEFGIIWIGDQ